MHKENLVYERLRPQEAIDIPLAEIDPKVSDDTFCVATQNWGQTFIHRFNCSPSLYLFHPYSAVRRAAIAFTTHFAYDIALTFVALGNLLELGIPQYMPPVFKRISILFYISEAVYQSLSRGVLFGTYTYLRNPWMCFDFIITLASLPHIEIVNPAKFQLQSLRGIRIFDVITIIPGVRMMGRGVMLSLNGITGVALLFLSFLTSVTIVAKHIFSGVFQNKCVLEPPKNLNISYSDFIYDRRNWLANGLCGNLTGSQKCPSGYICLPDIEDSSEHAHFDSFIPSCINSLAFITHDDWGDIFDQILKATGPLSSIFFVPVIFFGSFCLLNLMLIVVISTYEAMVSAYEAKYQKVSAYTYHTYFQFDISQLSLYPLPTNRETLRKVFRERDDLLSHREAVQQTWEMLKNLMNLSQSIQQKIEKKHAQNRVIFIPKSARNIQNERQTILNRWINFTEKVKAISESSPFRWFILLTVCINAIFLASEHANMSPKVGEILDIGNMVCIAIFSVEILIWLIAIGPHYFLSIWNLLDLTIVILGIMSISTLSLKHTTGFRLFKLLNLLKFQKAWFPLQRISTVIVNSLGRIVRLIIVVFLLIFVFAIIGNRVLGPLYPYTTTLRWSFRTFEESLFMVLWIFTGEWINSLWNCMHESSNSVLCPIIFITYYLIGNLVIISVFAALLLRSFSDLGIQRRFPFFPEKKFNFKRYSKYVWKYIPAFFHKKEKSNINDYGDKKNSGISSKRTSDEFYSETKQKNKLQLVKKFIQSYKFEVIVNIIIISSCLVMVLHNTKNEEDYEMNQYITIFNIIFTVLFILEMLLRWFGNGIVNYFTSAWTLFDFFIIVVSVVQDLYLYLSQTRHMVNSLTVFRSLRCLRLLYRWHDIKLIIGALVLSIPGIFHTLLVVMVIWLPFAIMGIHFFAGNFYRCVDRNNQPIEEQAMNKSECIKNGYFWSNSVFNFDHIGNSYLSLFQLAMFTGWDSLVRLMVDFRGPDLAPEKDYKKEYYIFAVIFVFVGGFFSLNLFLGVVVNTFKYMRKEMEGGDIEILLTKTQKVYYRAMIKFSRRSPSVLVEPPTDKFSQFFYIISTSWWFRLIIFVVICANATVVAIQFQAKLEFIAHIRKIWEAVFTSIYIIEFLIKIIGLRKYYFKEYWNTFSLVILILDIIGEIVQQVLRTSANLLSFVYAFRILQVFHLLHLADFFTDLRLLTYAIAGSFTSLLHLSVLMCLVIFIYSILGMSLFGHIKHHFFIDDFVNFETLINSAILLFRLSTAEDWDSVYRELTVEYPFCDPDKIPKECGNKVITSFYLLTYIFLTNHVITNIFVAVILDNYKEAIAEEKFVFKEDNLISFYKDWKQYDPTATQFIPYEKLSAFLDGLNTELRVAKPNQVALVFMDLPIALGNKVHCLDVLKGIMKVKFETVEDTEEFRKVSERMQLEYEKMFPELKGSRFVETTMNLKRMDRAARIIQNRLKEYKEIKELKQMYSNIYNS